MEPQPIERKPFKYHDSIIINYKKSVEQDGYMYEHAPSFGEQVDRFAKNFQTQSEEGLQLCSEAIRDERICRLVKALVPNPTWGAFKCLGPDPNGKYVNMTKAKNREAVFVLLWGNKSEAHYYKRSHHCFLEWGAADTGWLEITEEELAANGLKSTAVKMEQGGFAIMDARLVFGMIEGEAVVALGFASTEEVKNWTPMKMPEKLRGQVEKIFGDVKMVNIKFE